MRWVICKTCICAAMLAVACGFHTASANDEVAEVAVAEQALQEWLGRFGEESYRIDRDSERRIIYATARQSLGEAGHREMRIMLDELADHLSETLFGGPPDYDVFVAIASPRDARQLFQKHNVGGSYVHRLRRLVSRDTGGSLRHEFFHVMHYGHMERLGQPHQLWVQEGIAALYEDYTFTNGEIVFLPNDRNAITYNRARVNRLVPWQNMFELPAERFMARATVLYPQARSIFEFVAAEGKLQSWYSAYVEHFDDDPTGQRAFEIAFDADLRDVEQQWKQWVSQQPQAESGEGIERGKPSLGIGSMPAGVNDGVLITQVLPGSTASIADVRVGDIVVAIDGRPTHTMTDVRRAIDGRDIGEEVVVRLRRGEAYESLAVRLRPLQPQ